MVRVQEALLVDVGEQQARGRKVALDEVQRLPGRRQVVRGAFPRPAPPAGRALACGRRGPRDVEDSVVGGLDAAGLVGRLARLSATYGGRYGGDDGADKGNVGRGACFVSCQP